MVAFICSIKASVSWLVVKILVEESKMQLLEFKTKLLMKQEISLVLLPVEAQVWGPNLFSSQNHQDLTFRKKLEIFFFVHLGTILL